MSPLGSSIDKHAPANFVAAHLNGKKEFGKEYARSVISRDQSELQHREEGGVGLEDEPGK